MTFGQGYIPTANAIIMKWYPIYIDLELESIALCNRGGIPADSLRHRVRSLDSFRQHDASLILVNSLKQHRSLLVVINHY